MKNNKLKICFITPAFPTFVCGVGDHIAKLCEELIKFNIEIHIITSKQIKVDKYYERLGIKFYTMIDKWDFAGWKKAYIISKKIGIDIIHFQYPIRYPSRRSLVLRFLPFTLPYVWLSLISGWKPKRIITIHEYYKVSSFAKIKIFFDMLFSSQIILVNQVDVLHVRGLINHSKISYIPIGPTIQTTKYSKEIIKKFKTKNNLNENFLLAYFGFIDKTKGFEDIIMALNILKMNYPEIRLLVVGETQSSTYLDQLKELIKELDLDKQIIWTGYVAEKDVGLYLQASDLVVLPYLSGATSNRSTLLVPLLLELPILSTYVYGITPKQFQDKMLLVSPKSPNKLAEKIDNLIIYPNKRRKLVESAKELSQMFNWSDIARKTMKIYDKTI
ncbi:glycosyltransferase [Patescibacteria group bacterium]